MTGTASSFGLSRVTAGANDVVYVPRGGVQGRRAVVLCHGYLGTARVFVDDPPSPNTGKFARALASKGLLCLSVDVGNTWGNATATARVEAARALAVSAYGAASDKIAVVGVSMGNLTALGYRRDFPTRVSGVVGIMPASDLNDLRNNNRASCQASVDTAWGVVYPAALPSGADPATNAASLSVPWVAYYSSGDTVVLPSTVTNLAAALGAPASVVSTADHGDLIMPGVNVDTVATVLHGWGC